MCIPSVLRCRGCLAVPRLTLMRLINMLLVMVFFFFSSRRRHTRCYRDWSSDVCSSDLALQLPAPHTQLPIRIVRPLALGGGRDVASPLRRSAARDGAIGLPAIMQRVGQLAGTIATGQAGPPRDRGLRGGRRGRLAIYARAHLLAKRAAEMQRIVHARSDRARRAQGLSVYRSSRKGERLVPAGKCPPPERAHQQPLGPPAQSAQRGENSD